MNYYLDFFSALAALGVTLAVFFLGIVFYHTGVTLLGAGATLAVTGLIDRYL